MARQRISESDCGALTNKGTLCKNAAGFHTSHAGTGNCYWHGGNAPGGPPGNKKAVRTHEHETIYLSALDDDEASLFLTLDLSARQRAEDNLRLACIREHRMLLRIRYLKQNSEDGMGLVSVTTNKGWNQGKIDTQQNEYQATLTSEMRVEDALTRLQTIKYKAIEQLREVLKDDDTGEDRLIGIVHAIDRSALTIAKEKAQL